MQPSSTESSTTQSTVTTTVSTSNTTLSTVVQISTAVASKISEIDAVLAQMDTNSTEYALITSVKDLLGDITALLTSSRVVRSAGSCETQLAKWTTIKGHFQNISIVLNQMDNTSVQVLSTLVASLKSFVEVNLAMIETEIS